VSTQLKDMLYTDVYRTNVQMWIHNPNFQKLQRGVHEFYISIYERMKTISKTMKSD